MKEWWSLGQLIGDFQVKYLMYGFQIVPNNSVILS